MERNCPNKGIVDATSAHTRHGANVCSLCLSGDDSGEATLEFSCKSFLLNRLIN